MSTTLKKIITLLAAALIVLLLNYIYGEVQKTFNIPVNNNVIIIDAGHGGRDPGATGLSGLREKDVNLEIAKRLKRYIEEGGGVVVMTREEDKGLYSETSPNKKREDMNNRKRIIKESGGDIFISIHLNSFPQSKYYGAQVFYFEGCEDSKQLAKVLQSELRRVLNRNNDREEKSTLHYFILKDNEVPSALVECGFLSNPEEERLLSQPEYQEKVAWSIYIGIMKYLSQPKN